jgi:hypothetical protein
MSYVLEGKQFRRVEIILPIHNKCNVPQIITRIHKIMKIMYYKYNLLGFFMISKCSKDTVPLL